MAIPGQRDYSGLRLTQHALLRFETRFGGTENDLRQALRQTRRLGRNPDTGAIAVMSVFHDRMLVAILQNDACLTILTWNQFEPQLPEFGRVKLPRKRGRFLRRLAQHQDHDGREAHADPPQDIPHNLSDEQTKEHS